MSTNNFAFENRCIVVEDDDFTFENVPKHLEYVQGSNRNYPSYYLDKYRHRFHTLDIVITAAYYSGACIDYTPNDKYLDCIYECRNYVSNRDADGASPYLAWENGTFQVQPDGTLEPLASPVWNWSAFYERTLRDLMQSGIPSRSEEIAVNNWWGLSTGMVDLELSPSLPSGVKQLALLLKESIIRGTFDPFLRPIHDQTGARKSDGTHSFTPEELMRMDWLCSDVEGSIPSFEELLPQSRNLVKLLGTNREKELS